jgi:hypothetical protein
MKLNTRGLIVLLTLLVWSLQSMPIAAEESPQKPTRPISERFEPEAIVIEDTSGASFVCFTPPQGKEVARIFTDYHTIWSYMVTLEVEILTLNREITLLSDNVDRWENLYFEADERGNTYKDAFESTYNLLTKSEKTRYDRDRWGWVPWSITALVVVAAGVVVVAQ